MLWLAFFFFFFWEIPFTEAERKLSSTKCMWGGREIPQNRKNINGKQLLEFISVPLQLPDLTSSVYFFSALYLVFLLSMRYIQNIACSII